MTTLEDLSEEEKYVEKEIKKEIDKLDYYLGDIEILTNRSTCGVQENR